MLKCYCSPHNCYIILNVLGFGADAVSWLLSERSIRGIGTECIDVELPEKSANAVKQLIAARNRYSVVQLTNLENLPSKGILTTIAPMKLRGGAGGPARVLARVVKKIHNKNFSNKNKNKPKNHHHNHKNRQRKERNNAMMQEDKSAPSKGQTGKLCFSKCRALNDIKFCTA